MPQMQEQEKSPEKELNETEAINLSDIEFKVIIIRMLNNVKIKEIDIIKRINQK